MVDYVNKECNIVRLLVSVVVLDLVDEMSI